MNSRKIIYRNLSKTKEFQPGINYCEGVGCDKCFLKYIDNCEEELKSLFIRVKRKNKLKKLLS